MLYRFFLLFALITFRLESEPLKVSIQAKSGIVLNAENGAVLYEKHAEQPCFPASTTKIATLIYVLENNPELEAQVTISKTALALVNAAAKKRNPKQFPPYILEHDGTLMGLKVGEVWPFQTLLYGMMLPSGNDAANAVAEFHGGSIEQFMNGLNRFIQNELGLKNTHFCNPHGLHLANHYTTPHDLARITQFALKNPKFREIVKTLRFETTSQTIPLLAQNNRLMKKGPCFYSKAIGIKTGYHSNAGHTIVAAAEHEGRTLIAVLMGYEDPNLRYRDAIALFEKAFKEKKAVRTLFTKQFDLFSVSIPKADKPLNAKLLEDIQLEYYPSEEPKLHSSVYWHPMTLPVEKGSCVGEIKILDEKETLILSAPIYAEDRIAKTLFFRVADLCKNHYFQGGIIEALIACGMIFYFRKIRANKLRHSSKESSAGRD